MRLTLPLMTVALAAVTLTACSKKEVEPADNRAATATETNAPDVAPSAAPNVAFSYAYRFALAANDIAAVQEKHAAACEALGLARCRITGVSYQRSGSDRVNAALSLALAPDLARKFGKDAAAAVDAAHGTVGDIEIGGVDKSAEIRASDDALATAHAERVRLETALTNSATPETVKRDLRGQLGQQRAAEQAASHEARDARVPVALTPMRFDYSTDGYMPGLSIDRTARAALAFAALVLNGLIAIAVVLLTLAVPAGMLLLGLAHGRRLATRLWTWLAPQPEPAVE